MMFRTLHVGSGREKTAAVIFYLLARAVNVSRSHLPAHELQQWFSVHSLFRCWTVCVWSLGLTWRNQPLFSLPLLTWLSWVSALSQEHLQRWAPSWAAARIKSEKGILPLGSRYRCRCVCSSLHALGFFFLLVSPWPAQRKLLQSASPIQCGWADDVLLPWTPPRCTRLSMAEKKRFLSHGPRYWRHLGRMMMFTLHYTKI